MAGIGEDGFGELSLGGEETASTPGHVIGTRATEVDLAFAGSTFETAPNYAAAILLDGPLVYLPVGEAAIATQADDYSGNARHAARSQGTFGVTGVVPTRLPDTAYGGPTSGTTGLGIAYASWVNVATITLEAWVKTSAGTAGGIWNRDSNSTRVWQAGMTAAGKLFFTVIAGANPTINSIASINDGVKHHIVVTYDGTTAKTYIDGALDNTVALSQALAVPTATGLTFGNSNRTTASRFNGTIDEIAVYGGVLSPTRILSHYIAGTVLVVPGARGVETETVQAGAVIYYPAPGQQVVEDDMILSGQTIADSPYVVAVMASGPTAWYRLGEASTGADLTDSSGNNHDGVYGSAIEVGVSPLIVEDADTAVRFGGGTSTNMWATVPYGEWMDSLFENSYSVEYWVKPEPQPDFLNILMIRGNLTNPGLLSQVYGFHYGVKTSTGYFDVAASGFTGTIAHIVATVDVAAHTLTIYVNAVLSSSESFTGTLAHRTDDLHVGGGDPDGNDFYQNFMGVVDEIAFYDRVLGGTEIRDHWFNGTDNSIYLFGGQAVETEIVQAGVVHRTLVGAQAVETDTVQAGVVHEHHYVAGGQAVETEICQAGTVSSANVYFGEQAIETDSVQAGTVTIVLIGGTSVEADTAQAGTLTIVVIFPGGRALELDLALSGNVLGGSSVGTVRWIFHDPTTSESWTVPINPNSMSPIVKRRDLAHSGSLYGTLSMQTGRREESFDFTGVIRSQDHYDQLVTWARKRNAVEVTDHVGRRFRIYITDFDATDRSPIPRAPKRWRYVMKSKLLAGPL